MTLIGFHYKKMFVEKKKSISGKINVKSNVTFKSAKEAKVNLGSSKQKGVEFTFKFTTNYLPDIGNIELDGAVVYIGDAAVVDKILAKPEDLPEPVKTEVYNYLLARCNIQALIMERDMGLPPHLPMPKVGQK